MRLFLNMPLLMVVAFLLLTIVLAFYYTKKVTSFREYAVGNKQFPTATLVGTVLATLWGGGGLVHSVSLVHKHGLYFIISLLISPLNLWALSRLALRMRPFMHHLSIAETIGSIYGRYPRIITALISIAGLIATIAIQINVMSFAIASCISLNLVYVRTMTISATVILMIYATIGGIRVVTFTDIVQIGAFCIVLPLLSWWLFIKFDKPIGEVFATLHAQEKYQLSPILRFNIKLVHFIAFVLGTFFYCRPEIIQRLYMASSCFQTSKVFRNSTIINFFIICLIVLVALFVSVAKPALLPTQVWEYIIDYIPPILKGSIAISLIALAMSTADSCLNTCTVLVSHDILESISSTKTVAAARQFWFVKVVSLMVGLLAMIVAFYCNNLAPLFTFILNLYTPLIAPPFVLAIFGFRGSTHTALLGMAIGALAILVWNRWVRPKTGIDGSFICMLTNGLAMMIAHHLWPPPANKRGYW